MDGKYQSLRLVEPWGAPVDDGLSCEHKFTITRQVESERPAYVTGPVVDKFCSRCGVKQSLRQRLAEALTETPFVPAEVPRAPAPPPKTDELPEPTPLADIVVRLDLDKYGKRYDHNRQHGNEDKAVNVGPDPRWTDAMAAAAEEYVGKALGLPFKGGNKRPDRGYDFIMHGRRIQVKWTRRDDGRLIASLKSHNVADYYVLVTGETTDAFDIKGWATIAELKRSLRNLGYGQTYAIGQEDLRPFETLLEIRLNG